MKNIGKTLAMLIVFSLTISGCSKQVDKKAASESSETQEITSLTEKTEEADASEITVTTKSTTEVTTTASQTLATTEDTSEPTEVTSTEPPVSDPTVEPTKAPVETTAAPTATPAPTPTPEPTEAPPPETTEPPPPETTEPTPTPDDESMHGITTADMDALVAYARDYAVSLGYTDTSDPWCQSWNGNISITRGSIDNGDVHREIREALEEYLTYGCDHCNIYYCDVDANGYWDLIIAY